MSAKLLTKEVILAAQDIKTEDVEVPEWGGTIRMRTLTGVERDAWENRIQVKAGTVDIRGMKVLLISKCAIDTEGNSLFTKEDLGKLNAKNARAIDRLWQVAGRMNGIGKEALEELRKNS